MKIHSVHPKFLSDETITAEHDFLHKLFDALMDKEEDHGFGDDPDYNRFTGKCGVLYPRHRMLMEEMDIRGTLHETLLDRREIHPDEMDYWSPSDDDVFKDRDELASGGEAGRFSLGGQESAEDAAGRMDVCSALADTVEDEILLGLWRIYGFTVMERSYNRYRLLSDPLRGKKRGQVWILFDLMIEEALSVKPDENGPRIAYETVWEALEPEASEVEKAEFEKIIDGLEPGKISVQARKFLSQTAARQSADDLLKSHMLKYYL